MGRVTLPHAIVFDLDGTLTDTEVTWERVRRGLAAADGVPYLDAYTRAMMGMSTPEWARYCVEVIGLAGTPQEVTRRVIDGVADAYRAGQVRLLPGATDCVRRMAASFPVAVASSSPPELIDVGLAALGVSELVPIRVSSENVGIGKPAPDVYLEACRRLGVDAAACVAIEDSTAGIRSAHAAGMRVVAVPPAILGPSPDALALADASLGTLDELSLDLVAALFR